MVTNHKQVLESCERVSDILTTNPPPNPPAAYAGWVQELDGSIARANALLADQAKGQKESRDDTKRQRVLRRRLRVDHMQPIARIAKAFLASDPGVQKALAMPSTRLFSTKLLAEAAGFRQSAEKHKDTFIANGRPADFLEQLDKAADALREAVLNRARSVGLHIGAKAGLDEELRKARGIVNMLDAVMQNAFASNAELLARWNAARRVKGSTGGRPRPTGGTADENLPLPPATSAPTQPKAA